MRFRSITPNGTSVSSPVLPWYTNGSVIYSALVSVVLSLSVATAVVSTGTIRRMEQEAAQNPHCLAAKAVGV